MHKVASDLNKAKREPFFHVVVADWDHRDCSTGDSLQKGIFGWLSPPDPWKNHHAACKLRQCGTADWFIYGNTFSEWRTSEAPGSLLWVHGKRLLIPSFCGSTETKFFWFLFRSGRWKKRVLVREIFRFPFRNLSCSSAPQSSKTSVPCGKLDSHH
jgi:hypothetical protein